jgi:predicted aspartyl protease
MTGIVDDSGRALLPNKLRHPTTTGETLVQAWVDTGFTGELVLAQKDVAFHGFPVGQAVRATLADGSEIVLDTFACLLEWFGEWKEIEVIVNSGQFPLLGIGLLQGHELHVDYSKKCLSVV